MAKFKIFYSWQSDLPGSQTRNFIRKCIDDAIFFALESEAIDAIRDEATKDTTGSPDIVTTLFSKIDECDLFIADISLCFTGDNTIPKNGVETRKRSPNPNVLVELGYAVKTLSWDRVICLYNTDYGNEFPFDIEHNRRTPFSLKGKNKDDVQKEIARIILTNIQTLKGQAARTKPGMANYIIGSYDDDQHKVYGGITPLVVEEQEYFVKHNDRILQSAKNLYCEIQALSDKIEEERRIEEKGTKTSPISPQDDPKPTTISDQSEIVRSIAKTYMGAPVSVVWKADDIEKDTKLIKDFLSVDVNRDFFTFYNLKRINQMFNGTKLVGSDDEITKYEKLQDLSYYLYQLKTRLMYVSTFKGLLFIPLAIQNISEKSDENIRIVINIECGEIIEPDKNLICNELQGAQWMICKDEDDENDIGVIAELFIIPEDDIIQTEVPPFYHGTPTPKIPIFTRNGLVLSRPQKTEEDYEDELREYISSTEGCGYYEYNVRQLRPRECCWLSTGMLIKPVDESVVINYQIYSSHSSGDICGKLEYKI